MTAYVIPDSETIMGNAQSDNEDSTAGAKRAGRKSADGQDNFVYNNDVLFKRIPSQIREDLEQSSVQKNIALERQRNENGDVLRRMGKDASNQSIKEVLKSFHSLSIGNRLKYFSSFGKSVAARNVSDSSGEPTINKDHKYLINILMESSLFSSFIADELGDIVRHFERVSFPQGTLVLQEGEPGDYFYVVKKGRLRLYSEEIYLLKELAEGDAFGELGIIIPQKPRTASAQCLTPCAIYRLHCNDFQEHLSLNTKRLLSDARKILLSIDPFSKLNSTELTGVIKKCHYEKRRKGDLLLQMGSQPKAFYIVVKGSVVITGDGMKPIRLGAGTYFGDRSFLYGEPISKDVHIGETFTTLLVLERLDFLNLPEFLFQELRKKLTKLQLDTHAVFKNLGSNGDIVKKEFKVVSFENGKKIITEGDEPKFFYIVKEGTCRVSQQRKTGKQGYSNKLRSTKNKVRLTYSSETYLGELTVNDVFGEMALLGPEGTLSKATVAAKGRVACYVLDRHNFRKYLSQGDYFQKIMNARRNDKTSVTLKKIKNCDLRIVGTLFARPLCRAHIVEHTDTRALLMQRTYIKREMERYDKTDLVRSERRLLLELHHPFIINLLKTYQDHACVHFVEEWLPGGDVLGLMSRAKNGMNRLNPSLATIYAGCILLAMGDLRLRNILCRSICPENLLIDKYGFVKISNFQFAKKLAGNTKTKTIFGTVEYMAPEQIFGMGQDCCTDLWHFGILIYEMLVGHTPFSSTGECTNKDVFARILIGFSKEQTSQVPGKAAKLLLERLLNTNPSTRLGSQSVSDVQNVSWFDQINFKKLYEKNINDTLRSVMWVPDFDPSNLTQWFSIRQDQQIFYKSELISKTKETKRQNKNANITPGQNRYEQQWWSYEF